MRILRNFLNRYGKDILIVALGTLTTFLVVRYIALLVF